jgi:hypothetical protein
MFFITLLVYTIGLISTAQMPKTIVKRQIYKNFQRNTNDAGKLALIFFEKGFSTG